MQAIPVSTLKVFGMQSILLNEISRCILFARKMDGLELTVDRFVKSTLLKQAVIVWYQIFGARGEDCHWSQVANKQNIIEPFNRDVILHSFGGSLDKWSRYHEDMKLLRNKFIAHFDMDIETIQFPNMEFALAVTEAYRDWLYRLFGEYSKSFPASAAFMNTENFNVLIEREWKEKITIV